MSAHETSVNVHYKVGKWLPSDQGVLDAWTAKIAAKADKDTSPLLPAVQNLKTLIETDAKAYMFFTQMFQDVPESRKTSP
ncbi:phophatidylserine decarboxylase associated domain-containing protein, partial [Ruegeria hyattellae]|uniref:phophatidylserine decarboxylase associated domain-containing protein n=1 Tax=Ruegeria hyattellae TaxID=3233337 RepID=UPI00355B91CD